MFRSVRHCIAAWATALALTGAFGPARAGDVTVAPGCTLAAGPVHAVARVLDGDTLQLDDGSELRLIGALAPHAGDADAEPGAWPPAEAAQHTLSDLVLGRSIALAFDGMRKDRYGRWLAHAAVETEGGKTWVQGAMLERGMARVYTRPDNAACSTQLLARERPAREGSIGLWANAAYQVRTAENARELLAYRHTFQIVKGRIAAISATRGATYLNFAPGRRGFAVVIKRASQAMPIGTPDDLRGRIALVRGWIDRRNGPVIEMDANGQIELLDGPPAVGSLREEAPVRGYGWSRKQRVPGGRAAGRE
jgi:micrococcal nuclease